MRVWLLRILSGLLLTGSLLAAYGMLHLSRWEPATRFGKEIYVGPDEMDWVPAEILSVLGGLSGILLTLSLVCIVLERLAARGLKRGAKRKRKAQSRSRSARPQTAIRASSRRSASPDGLQQAKSEKPLGSSA